MPWLRGERGGGNCCVGTVFWIQLFRGRICCDERVGVCWLSVSGWWGLGRVCLGFVVYSTYCIIFFMCWGRKKDVDGKGDGGCPIGHAMYKKQWTISSVHNKVCS